MLDGVLAGATNRELGARLLSYHMHKAVASPACTLAVPQWWILLQSVGISSVCCLSELCRLIMMDSRMHHWHYLIWVSKPKRGLGFNSHRVLCVVFWRHSALAKSSYGYYVVVKFGKWVLSHYHLLILTGINITTTTKYLVLPHSCFEASHTS